jgi:hypothetical protein
VGVVVCHLPASRAVDYGSTLYLTREVVRLKPKTADVRLKPDATETDLHRTS